MRQAQSRGFQHAAVLVSRTMQTYPTSNSTPAGVGHVKMFSGSARAVFEFSFTGSSSYFTGSFDSAEFVLVTRSERHRLASGR